MGQRLRDGAPVLLIIFMAVLNLAATKHTEEAKDDPKFPVAVTTWLEGSKAKVQLASPPIIGTVTPNDNAQNQGSFNSYGYAECTVTSSTTKMKIAVEVDGKTYRKEISKTAI